MTIQNQNTKNVYVGNGSTTVFPYTFTMNSDHPEYIHVYITGEDGIARETTDFKVDVNAGNVVYPKPGSAAPALAAGQKITLLREVPLQQNLALVNQGPFFAESIEQQLDDLEMQIQQLREATERSLKTSVESMNFNAAIPLKPGKSFRINQEGTGFEVTEDPAVAMQAAQISATLATVAKQAAEEAQGEAEQCAKIALTAAIKQYSSVADVQNDIFLRSGMMVFTSGYYTANDGGGGTYRIREATLQDLNDDGTIIVLNNGFVAELVVRNGIVNVKQFGAKGDGVKDDTDYIKKALAVGAGKTIVFPRGIYLVSNLLHLHSHTKIVGSPGKSVIKGAGTDKYALFGSGVSHVSISGIDFTYLRRGIDFRDSTNIQIVDCSAYDMHRDATLFQDNYFIQFIDVSDIIINNLAYNNKNLNSDCIRFKGNCSRVYASNITGSSGDDFIAIVPDETDDGATAHKFSNAIFTNININKDTFRALRLQTMNPSSQISGVTFLNCRLAATTMEALLMCATPHGSYDALIAGGSLRNIVFDNCEVHKHEGISNMIIRVNTQKLHGVSFKNCEFISDIESLDKQFFKIEYCTSVQVLEITGSIFSDNKTNTNTVPIYIDANCTLACVYVKNCYFTGNATNKPSFIVLKGSASLLVRGCRLTSVDAIVDGSSAGTSNILLNENIGSMVYGVLSNASTSVYGSMGNKASAQDVGGTAARVISGNFVSNLTPSAQPSGNSYLYLDPDGRMLVKIKIGSAWHKATTQAL